MIVKTGANYQAEGGYIEFATGKNTLIVNNREVPSIVYSDSIMVSGLQSFPIKLTSGSGGTLRFVNYTQYTALTGEKFYDYRTISLDAGNTETITLPSGFASTMVSPEGYHPKIAEGSKNVDIINRTATTYYLITTGDSPNAVIELEANA